MTSALSLTNVTKRYGANTSVDAISLEVPAGAIVALLGPNGAGKSTTMKMCAGFIAPDEGTIAVAGKDIAADRDAARVRQGQPATVHIPALGAEMLQGQVSENARDFARSHGLVLMESDALAALLLKIQKPRFREQLGRPQQALLQQLGPRVDIAINSQGANH